jgi:hypothetical protein
MHAIRAHLMKQKPSTRDFLKNPEIARPMALKTSPSDGN